MRAAVLSEFEAPLVVEDLELLPPAPGDVVVRPGAVEVCVTDSYAVHPGPLAHPPAILGHSAAGVVEAVGTAVSTVAPGDRVLEAGLLDPAAMVDRTYPLADAGTALAAAEARELLTAVLLPQTDPA